MTPKHYKGSGKGDVIDFVQEQGLNFNLGNVIKYVTRAGRKSEDPAEDLKKAIDYLKRELEYASRVKFVKLTKPVGIQCLFCKTKSRTSLCGRCDKSKEFVTVYFGEDIA